MRNGSTEKQNYAKRFLTNDSHVQFRLRAPGGIGRRAYICAVVVIGGVCHVQSTCVFAVRGSCSLDLLCGCFYSVIRI